MVEYVVKESGENKFLDFIFEVLSKDNFSIINEFFYKLLENRHWENQGPIKEKFESMITEFELKENGVEIIFNKVAALIKNKLTASEEK